jgi:hypothetical protein
MYEELKQLLRQHLGLKPDEPLPLVLDVPVAGKVADMTPQRAYAAARPGGGMPTIQLAGRKKVPTLAWLQILAGGSDHGQPAEQITGEAAE